MKEVDREIERLERELSEEEEALVAVRIREVREREEELKWFGDLTDAERTDLFRAAPDTYRRAMDALGRRAARHLTGGAI